MLSYNQASQKGLALCRWLIRGCWKWHIFLSFSSAADLRWNCTWFSLHSSAHTAKKKSVQRSNSVLVIHVYSAGVQSSSPQMHGQRFVYPFWCGANRRPGKGHVIHRAEMQRDLCLGALHYSAGARGDLVRHGGIKRGLNTKSRLCSHDLERFCIDLNWHKS